MSKRPAWRGKAPHKYRAKPVVLDGVWFPSGKEAARWSELALLERAGAIRDLQRQVRMPLIVEETLICHIVIDFTYVENNARVFEDAKGMMTEDWKLKRKLFEALYGSEIRIS